jgi:integrase
MPKRAKEMSARQVASIKNDGRYAVGGVIGLYLHVRGVSRCWLLRVKVSGRRRELGLGSFPEVSLATARDRAWDRRRSLLSRQMTALEHMRVPTDPPASSITQQASRETATFESCARTYVAAQTPGWKSGKHAKQWIATLETYAFPVIGKLDVAVVAVSHMLQILEPIWTTKTETATRLRGRIESILDWAAHRKYRSGKNPASWDGNLKHELPSPTKLKKRKKQHHPALPYMRIAAFMVDLRSRTGISIRALEWGILTAARSQEIRGARRSEINTHLRRWTIPGERMKLEKDHVVPLSEAAMARFESLPISKGSDLLFPAPEGGELSDAAFGALIDGMHEANLRQGGIGYLDPLQDRVATQHGFRSTFRDWAAEIAFFPSEIIEHALAHKLKGEAEAAYQRGTMLIKRAALMEQWARFCNEDSIKVFNLGSQLKTEWRTAIIGTDEAVASVSDPPNPT